MCSLGGSFGRAGGCYGTDHGGCQSDRSGCGVQLRYFRGERGGVSGAVDAGGFVERIGRQVQISGIDNVIQRQRRPHETPLPFSLGKRDDDGFLPLFGRFTKIQNCVIMPK